VGGEVANRVTIKYQRQCGAVGVDSSTCAYLRGAGSSGVSSHEGSVLGELLLGGRCARGAGAVAVRLRHIGYGTLSRVSIYRGLLRFQSVVNKDQQGLTPYSSSEIAT
jgi:hypothetical protein